MLKVETGRRSLSSYNSGSNGGGCLCKAEMPEIISSTVTVTYRAGSRQDYKDDQEDVN